MEINKASSKVKRQSRRSFLGQLGVGVVGIATLSSGLLGFAKHKSEMPSNEFPGPDSMFHPAVDTRQDPRRS